MSNFLALATVTATLQRTLQAALDVDLPGARVTTDRPDQVGTGQPSRTGLNLYLYQVQPSAARRNADLPTRSPNGRLVQQPRTAWELHYILTCYGDEGALEPQRILGSAVRTLHARPIVTRAAIEATLADEAFGFLAGSTLGDEAETVKLTPLGLSLEELSKLWSVFFQTPYSLSVAYAASVVLIEAEERPEPILPVQVRNIFATPSLAGATLPLVTPDTLADLQLWLRSDEAITFDNQGVAAWGDGSGNRFHAVQPEANRRPALVPHAIGTRPALRFDGTDDFLALEGLRYTAAGVLPGLTVFALVRSESQARGIVVSFDRDAYWHLALKDEAALAATVGWDTTDAGGDDHHLQATRRFTDNQWHLLCGRFEQGAAPSKRLFVDGVEVGSAPAHGGNALGSGATRFGLIGVGSQAATFNGARGPEWFLAGDLAELLVFHRALPDAERQALERYFARRYAG